MALEPTVRRTLQTSLDTVSGVAGIGAMQRLSRGLLTLMLVCLLATIGYQLNGWSLSDSFYMVVITIFTVGYAEVHPVETFSLRAVTILTIVFGYVATLMVLTGLAQLVIDGEFRRLMGIRRIMNEIEKLHGHVIICGYGRMGRRLANRLVARGRTVIVIDRDEEPVGEAIEQNLLALRGNATEEAMLTAAGVDRAATLVTSIADDAASLFITITARGLNPNLQILARGEQPTTVGKLRQVGADHVVLTAAIGADRLSQLILRPGAEAMLANEELPPGLIDDLEVIGLSIDELELTAHSSLAGRSLHQLHDVGGSLSFLVIAIRREAGHVILNPPADTTLRRGDSVLIMGYESEISELCEQFALQREPIGEEAEIED